MKGFLREKEKILDLIRNQKVSGSTLGIGFFSKFKTLT